MATFSHHSQVGGLGEFYSWGILVATGFGAVGGFDLVRYA